MSMSDLTSLATGQLKELFVSLKTSLVPSCLYALYGSQPMYRRAGAKTIAHALRARYVELGGHDLASLRAVHLPDHSPGACEAHCKTLLPHVIWDECTMGCRAILSHEFCPMVWHAVTAAAIPAAGPVPSALRLQDNIDMDGKEEEEEAKDKVPAPQKMRNRKDKKE